MTSAARSLRTTVFCPTPLGIFEQSRALQERGELESMLVDVYCDVRKRPYAWLPQGRARSFLTKRFNPGIDSSRVRIRPLPSMLVRLGSRITKGVEARNSWTFWHNHQFDRFVARQLPKLGNLAFGYESSSLFTFRRAKQLGIPTVLYQPIGVAEYALEVLGEEARRHPQLADTLRYNWFPQEELSRRREERQLADAIICASSFTKRTLIDVGVPAEKIFVEPYGVDQSMFAPQEPKHDRFSVIWASAFTQTKGIQYLLDALADVGIPDLELVVAGHPIGHDPIKPFESRFRVRRIGKVSRAELAKEMVRCHAHVFPTLLEGFGRNIIEAMASGLPVITTANCAGPDLIEHGKTGFIVPIRDVAGIQEHLRWLHAHPTEARELGLRARERVAPLTPPDYRRRFADRIEAVWNAHLARAAARAS